MRARVCVCIEGVLPTYDKGLGIHSPSVVFLSPSLSVYRLFCRMFYISSFCFGGRYVSKFNVSRSLHDMSN